jgi:hypothetical protein
MKLFNKPKPKDEITEDDLVVVSMLFFQNGCFGEMAIHETIYNILQTQEFADVRPNIRFRTATEGNVYSPSIHNAIERNCKSIAVINPMKTLDTEALFCDELRFDNYDRVKKLEEKFSENIRDYEPKVFYLTSQGRGLVSALLAQKFSKKQREVLLKMVNNIDSFDNTSITDDINEHKEPNN